MRLIRITLKNYRIHRQLSVDFDPSCTLIGGPNESGKSTLVEGIHRALFLKAKGNSEAHREMVAEGTDATPEVQLEFETGGFHWRLSKSFGPAAKGRVSLSDGRGTVLAGDEAEERLTALVRSPLAGPGKEMLAQWAHLWVWQGKSGDDPGQLSQRQHEALIRRLQEFGGAGLVQSESDCHAVTVIATRVEETFNKNGTVKVGSELGAAERAVGESRGVYESARRHWDQHGQRVDDLAALLGSKEEDEQKLGVIESDLETAARSLEKVRELRDRLKQEKLQLTQVEGSRDRISKTLDDFANHRASLKRALDGLEPIRTKQGELKANLETVKNECVDADLESNQTRETARRARLTVEWLNALVGLGQAEADVVRSESKMAQIEALKKNLTQVRQKLATCRQMDQKGLKRLESLQQKLREAEIALQAMAAQVELVESDQSVSLDGELLTPGSSRLLANSGDLLIGSGTRIRISPGGGGSLSEARENLETARKNLRQELEAHGFSDIAEARGAHEEWSIASRDVKDAEQAIQVLDAESIAKELDNHRGRLIDAQQEVNRVEPLVRSFEFGPVPDAGLMKGRISDARSALKLADEQAKSAEARLETAKKSLKRAEDNLAAASEEAQQLENRRIELTGRLELLQATHGDPIALENDLQQVKTNLDATLLRMEQVQSEINALDPDALEMKSERLATSRERLIEKLVETRDEVLKLQTLLQSEMGGEVDPRAALEQAAATLKSREQHCEALRLQGEAFCRLRDLFEEEQRSMASRLVQPFQERIARYLRWIFGAGADICVELGSNEFGGISLLRNEGSPSRFEFASLSGGTREQVAVAFRLAMAEVLAMDHDGCLPIVLDDAFAYSDSERVKALQDMLFLASKQGLQIVLLTCTPRDYTGMAGSEVPLRRPLQSGPVSLTKPDSQSAPI